LNESRIGGIVADGFAVRASTGTCSSLHAQHGAGILIGVDADVIVTTADGARVRGRAVAIPPHLVHATFCAGPSVGLLYDPEASPRVSGYTRRSGAPFALDPHVAARVHGAVLSARASLAHVDVLRGLGQETATRLGREATEPRIDRRVARVVEALRDPATDRREIIARAGISEAHLQALFARDIGLPIRTFQLWRRLLAAVRAMAQLDATHAAHDAGFADLAHFSRTCRRMLGYSPTDLRDGMLRR
jgi:AraC-like DNA-binding protein